MEQEYIVRAIKVMKEKLGHELDLDNETYVLQTPDAFLELSMEEDDKGKRHLKVHLTGGHLTYLETDERIFEDIFESGDDEE